MQAIVRTSEDSIRVAEVEVPSLRRDGEVLVKVEAAGLCRTDTYAALGQIPTVPGVTFGHEFSGTFVESNVSLDGIVAGVTVAVMPILPKGERRIPGDLLPSYDMLGIHRAGCFAEFVTVPASAVRVAPKGLDPREVAYAEPVAASLAVLRASIRPDQRGVIFGDNRIATLTLRVLHSAGFGNVELSSELIDLPSERFDFVVETGLSSSAFREILRVLKPRGTLVVKSRQHHEIAVRPLDLLNKEVRIETLAYGSFDQALELLGSGAVRVDDLIGTDYGFASFAELIPHSLTSEEAKPFLLPSL